MSTRQITIYSGGGAIRTMESEKTVWGDLKTELTTLGVSLNNINAMVGETEVSLESAGAQLPEGNFTLFLLPVNVKSGATEEGPTGPSSLLEKFKALAGVGLTAPQSEEEEEEPYEESYEESYEEEEEEEQDLGLLPIIEEPKKATHQSTLPQIGSLGNSFEEQSIVWKLQIIKELVAEIEEYFKNKVNTIGSEEVKKYHEKAEELKRKLFM